MKKYFVFFLTFLILFTQSYSSFGAERDFSALTKETVNYILNNNSLYSYGKEWGVIGLARSKADIPEELFAGYYNNIKDYVKKRSGILHENKYTEYSRVILALTSIGKNPADVSGYNLLTPLGDYEKIIWQGLNGPIWALIALDSGNYQIPVNPSASIQATREMYIEKILNSQLEDGGWSLFDNAEKSDPDITGMALQALSKYKSNEKVNSAIDKALNCISVMQIENGGFETLGTENAESCIQIIVALCELGISPEDPKFIKNNHTLIDSLMEYRLSDGSFKHLKNDNKSNFMATEQALYCLDSIMRLENKQKSLYSMNDARSFTDNYNIVGLPGKNPDIAKKEIIYPGKTFEDITANPVRQKIEALAARGIINGKYDNIFNPESTMTRAEFATIMANGLSLPAKTNSYFSDVNSSDWFYSYISTAYSYGIIKGVSESTFNPGGRITRQEAAVMVSRAAGLCGINTSVEANEARDVLAGFIDYKTISDWAFSPLALCYKTGILSDEDIEINPKKYVTRAEIADMLYNMLELAKLI